MNTNAPTYTVAATIFNALQTDARWQVDTVGYNAAFPIPAASLPKGSWSSVPQVYRVEIVIVPADGTPNVYVVAELNSKRLLTYSA